MINEELLKCELKRFGLKKINNFKKDILTNDQYVKVTEFLKNKNIIVRKADKSNSFVIMNKSDYNEKIDKILSDETKFKKISHDPIVNLKKKLNLLIDNVNAAQGPHHMQKLVGHFKPGYIYGTAKIHKNINDPPLRPIISNIGSPTYSVAQQLNSKL